MKRLVEDFRKFALQGNVVDMAVGIIIGGAFSTIVRSLVNDIVMPPIGVLLGNVDFQDLFWVLRSGTQTPGPYATISAAQEAGAITLNYGLFINNIISFFIMAFTVFMAIRMMNQARESIRRRDADQEEEAPITKECEYCFSVIPIQATRCPQCTSSLKL
jgi:large conductance mechanosensitive channel